MATTRLVEGGICKRSRIERWNPSSRVKLSRAIEQVDHGKSTLPGSRKRVHLFGVPNLVKSTINLLSKAKAGGEKECQFGAFSESPVVILPFGVQCPVVRHNNNRMWEAIERDLR